MVTMSSGTSVEEWYSAKKTETKKFSEEKKTEWSLHLRNKGLELDDLENPIPDL